jgi:hypothetical protein
MPRRRKRKTNWRPQEERRLRARGVRHGNPDARKLARAFIGLALAKAEAEAEAEAEAQKQGQQQAAGKNDADNPGGERAEPMKDDRASA